MVDNGVQNGIPQPIVQNLPDVAINASGAAGALASWAFASVSKKVCHALLSHPFLSTNSSFSLAKLSAAELEAPNHLSRSSTVPVVSAGNDSRRQIVSPPALNTRTFSEGASPAVSMSGSFNLDDEGPVEDWGGDLMDVNDDDGDWGENQIHFSPFCDLKVDRWIITADGFESGQAPPPRSNLARIDPLAQRLSLAKPIRKGGALKLGGTKSSALRIPMGTLPDHLASHFARRVMGSSR